MSLRFLRLLIPSQCSLPSSSYGRGYQYGLKHREGLHRSFSTTKTVLKYNARPTFRNYDSKREIVLSLQNDQSITLTHFFLRDNCHCSSCHHEQTRQRLLDTYSIPPDIRPRSIKNLDNGLSIVWDNDGHQSLYDWNWLSKRRGNTRRNHNIISRQTTLWSSSIHENPPTINYREVMESDAGVGDWTQRIQEFGFCYVDGCPPTPKATQKLLERISFIRQTHYGGFYDFTSDLSSKDTAYTSIALEAHTDTTYFTDPAGLQMFHLLSHEDGSGGASLLVDGYRAARILYDESREDYHQLQAHLVPYHASGNDGISIMSLERFPVLRTRRFPTGEYNQPYQIRWNNADRAAFETPHTKDYMLWYKAARKWVEILRRPDSEYWTQLAPGRPLIFDNWRVLHGRSAFTGKRRMCGGYINMDNFLSRWRMTNYRHEDIFNAL